MAWCQKLLLHRRVAFIPAFVSQAMFFHASWEERLVRYECSKYAEIVVFPLPFT